MKYYKRDIYKKKKKKKKGFPIILITGPRQSGKTTYIKHSFQNFEYFNLESLNDFEYISADPAGFLNQHTRHVALDEVQKMPQILSFLQVHVDSKQEMGAFVLSGSQNILLLETVTQSLAGRVAHVKLFPFSIKELKKHKLLEKNPWEQIVKGFYPPLYTREVSPIDFYGSYISTFIERDVRSIKNIGDLSAFRTFMILLAGRAGQILDMSALASDVGVSVNTIKSWISVLEASYVIFKLPPFYKNANKRLVKSPKIYFYDTGVLSALLGIDSAKEALTHFARGQLFENLIIAEFKKLLEDTPLSKLYFYRDSNGLEVDLLFDFGTDIIPVEIKSAESFSADFLKPMEKLQSAGIVSKQGFLFYSGARNMSIKNNTVLPWNRVDEILAAFNSHTKL